MRTDEGLPFLHLHQHRHYGQGKVYYYLPDFGKEAEWDCPSDWEVFGILLGQAVAQRVQLGWILMEDRILGAVLEDRQGEGQQTAAADCQLHAVAESPVSLAVLVEGDLELETVGQLLGAVGHILAVHSLVLAVLGVLVDASSGSAYYYYNDS